MKGHALSNKKLPYVIDLFSGCGGMGLGFANAGFPILASVDNNQPAVDTAGYNLSATDAYYEANHRKICTDIRNLNIRELVPDAYDGELIVIGGPPCQAYSMAGRGKLRSLGADREHTKDARGNLYLDFLNLALAVNAYAIVMENVPAAINYGGKNVPEEACTLLEERGYKARWSILNAADYGVPQRRERMFLIGIRGGPKTKPTFPPASHKCPRGSLTQTDRMLNGLVEKNTYFEQPENGENLEAWVTTEDALSDLPALFESSDCPYYLPKPSEGAQYSSAPGNDFQVKMRGENSIVCGNGFRRTLRDFPIFERMVEGDDYRAAVKIAEALLEDKLEGTCINEKSDPIRHGLLKKETVPPYSLDKFHDKWKKLTRNGVSHTLPAHLGTDTYSHIHYAEPRGISVREAARLQSFPDDFVFPCSMGDAFKQIGNAVPPLLAEAIANTLKKEMIRNHEQTA